MTVVTHRGGGVRRAEINSQSVLHGLPPTPHTCPVTTVGRRP
jgi:hypothetical protein